MKNETLVGGSPPVPRVRRRCAPTFVYRWLCDVLCSHAALRLHGNTKGH